MKLKLLLLASIVVSCRAEQSCGIYQVGASPFDTFQKFPYCLAFSPDGTFLSVAHIASNSVVVFRVGEQTLSFIQQQPFATGKNPQSISYSPNGNLVAVANAGGTVTLFASNSQTGALTQVFDRQTNLSSSYTSVAFAPEGDFIALTNLGNKTVEIWNIDAETGDFRALTQELFFGNYFNISQFAAGLGNFYAQHSTPFCIAYAPNGLFAAVADSTAKRVVIFSVDRATGLFSNPQIQSFLTDVRFVTFSPNSLFMAAITRFAIRIFAIDQTTGALSEIEGSPYLSLEDPLQLAYCPDGSCMSVAHFASHTITLYSVGDQGDLSLAGIFKVACKPSWTAFSPTAPLLAVANGKSNSVTLFRTLNLLGAGRRSELSDYAVGKYCP